MFEHIYTNYVLQDWFLGSIGALLLIWCILWAMLVVWKAIIKRLWYKIRTWRMSPERYSQWQLSRVADGFTDHLENLILDGTLSPAEADELSRSLAHRNNLWDMLPRGKSELPSDADIERRWRQLDKSAAIKLVDAIPLPDVSWRGRRPRHQFFRRLRNRINRRNGHQGE